MPVLPNTISRTQHHLAGTVVVQREGPNFRYRCTAPTRCPLGAVMRGAFGLLLDSRLAPVECGRNQRTPPRNLSIPEPFRLRFARHPVLTREVDCGIRQPGERDDGRKVSERPFYRRAAGHLPCRKAPRERPAEAGEEGEIRSAATGGRASPRADQGPRPAARAGVREA